MATAKKTRYSAVTDTGFHYPDGFLALGQSAELSEDDALHGLSSGQLAVSPVADKGTSVSPTPDNAPSPEQEN